MDAEHDADDPQEPAEIRATPLWRRFGVRVTAGVVLYVVVGAVLLVSVPDRLLAHWFPTLDERARAAFLGPAANVVLFALGGMIALVGVGLSLSRHRQELDAAERDRQRLVDDREREKARRDEVEAQRRIDTERALRERFVTTVKLLSDPAPVNRQAALFALGALADDWDAFGKPDEVKVCIEVLTGYLRAPRADDMLVPLTQEQLGALPPDDRRPAQHTTAQEISVKQAGYTVIRNHLVEGAAPHWHDRDINLMHAHIDFALELGGATVRNGGTVYLNRATIGDGGTVYLGGATIGDGGSFFLGGATINSRGDMDLEGATVSDSGRVFLNDATINAGGRMSLRRATVSDGGTVELKGATINDGGTVDLNGATIGDGGRVFLDGATINGNADLDLAGATVSDSGRVFLDGATINAGGRVSLRRATVSDGGTVDLTRATINDRGTVDLTEATIDDGGTVDLTRATINDGGTVDLTEATIDDGGTVDLTEATIDGGGTVDITGATVSDGGLRGYEYP